MTANLYKPDDSINDSIKLRSHKPKNEPWNVIEQKKKRKKHYTSYDRDICAKHVHGSDGKTKKVFAEIKRDKKR